MNTPFLAYALGKLLQVLALAMVIPAAIAVYEAGPLSFPGTLLNYQVIGFLVAIISSGVVGTVLFMVFGEPTERVSVREGFAVVTFGWISFSLFGCIPLVFYFLQNASGIGFWVLARSFTDAFFEVMSGFTTTGATILSDIEAVPRGLLFWRSMTQWLGGMGIVTLGLLIFPAFGVAAYQMFRGEAPGPSKERLRPRMTQTATVLWGVYLLLTLLLALLLLIGGMSPFDAICHSFTTLATGGFSTRNQSIAYWNSDYIDWVLTIFMFFAGTNFLIHYRLLFFRDVDVVKKNREFHFYCWIILIAIVATAVVLMVQGVASPEEIQLRYRSTPLSAGEMVQRTEIGEQQLRSVYHILRYSAFQVVSVLTTTGFATTDFDIWPNVILVLFLLLMFFGGSAGSTAGGMKMARIMVLLKMAWREVRSMVQPRLILPIKIGGEQIEEKLAGNIAGFFVLFMLVFAIASGIMGMIIADFTTAVSSVIATMGNIGPGLSGVGAVENYGWIPLGGKWVLIACMLLGRLEIYTVLITFAPGLWKK